MVLFASLCILQVANPKAVSQTMAFFGPAREFYKLGVPLFFSAPLVDLPLALLPIPRIEVAKIITVLAVGTAFTLVSSFFIVSSLLPRAVPAPPSEAAAPSLSPIITLVKPPSPWPLALAALLASAALHGAGHMAYSIVALSIFALQVRSHPRPSCASSCCVLCPGPICHAHLPHDCPPSSPSHHQTRPFPSTRLARPCRARSRQLSPPS